MFRQYKCGIHHTRIYIFIENSANMFVGLLNGRTERRKKKKEKLEKQKEREREKRGGRVKKKPSFTLPARGNPYRISNKYRGHVHYRPISGTWSAYQSWAQITPPGGEATTRRAPVMAPPRGGFDRLNEKITQNIDTEGMSLWLCEQRIRRVIICHTASLFIHFLG